VTTANQPPPRLHHFVPRFYLARFARGRRLLVKRRDASRAFRSSVDKIAAENDLYTVFEPDGSRNVKYEHLLGKLERAAAPAMAMLAAGRLPRAGSAEREGLSAFVALQAARTPETRDRLLFPSDLMKHVGREDFDENDVRSYLSDVHLKFEPDDDEVRAATDWVKGIVAMGTVVKEDEWIEIMFSSALATLGPSIAGLSWSLEISSSADFLTSDNPVAPWRAPSARDAFEGVGIGTADETRFPVSSSTLLVLTRGGSEDIRKVGVDRVKSVNAHLAARCRSAVYGDPEGTAIREARLAPHRPAVRFHEGPGYDPDGNFIDDIIHVWIPANGGARPIPPA